MPDTKIRPSPIKTTVEQAKEALETQEQFRLCGVGMCWCLAGTASPDDIDLLLKLIGQPTDRDDFDFLAHLPEIM